MFAATLRLEVTPNVIDGDTLKLKILTNKDEPDFSRPVAGNPTIITKKAETNVILLNGQTTVIGGLNKETTSSSQAGIPYLKDVPGLGWLFGSRSRSGAMEDVLIFITPYILEEKAPGGALSFSGAPLHSVKPAPP
ncbi:MAG: type II and III secretion system protein [Deltaproteobacteria bacterium]|nr:type II and III secretion system protein [Deltaproteobacteria bacterium]